MSDSSYTFSNFIINTLVDASKIANTYFGNLSAISTKSQDNNQVLTQADIEIDNFLISKIQKKFPQHNIIDEEAGVINNNHEYTWVVDPIDGTSNFANGLPLYGIMIGVLCGSHAIAGGIALPAFGHILNAEKGSGSFCNGEKVFVSTQHELLSSLIAYGIDGHQDAPDFTSRETKLLGKIILNIRNLRMSNSAYDIVQVAMGKYGAFLNLTTKIWDNVALQPIIEEAGGIVTDFWGQKMDYTQALDKNAQNYTICAAAPEIHRQLQEIIQKEW